MNQKDKDYWDYELSKTSQNQSVHRGSRNQETGKKPDFKGAAAIILGMFILLLILEALAQTGAAALLSDEAYKGKLALFGGIRNARFRRQVVPGDVLELKCEIISMKGPAGIGKATAFVDGQTAVSAELIFALADR